MRRSTSTPRTLVDNPGERRTRNYPREASPFWVEVVISKGGGGIETRKYRGEELVSLAANPPLEFPLLRKPEGIAFRRRRIAQNGFLPCSP